MTGDRSTHMVSDLNPNAEESAQERGVLRRIENGQAMPSQTSIRLQGWAMAVSLTHLLKNCDLSGSLVRHVPQKFFEPFLITLDYQSEVFSRSRITPSFIRKSYCDAAT
jgi:hypothetical protein